MKLTEECKEVFQEWYLKVYAKNNGNFFYWVLFIFGINSFYLDTLSEQYGVYEDFFDSVDLELVVHKFNSKYVASVYFKPKSHLDDEEIKCNKKGYKTRCEAQVEVIKKANIMFNSKESNV